MATVTVQFMSEALWREVTYTALLPDSAAVGPGPYPVLLQLHGGNQSHTSWLRFSRLAQHAADLPMIVVLPDGAQTRWANGRTPFEAYEDFLVDELPRHLRQSFHASEWPWAIGGNSMGGFGAARLGLKYPERFCSVWAHSGGFPTADTLAPHWYWAGDPRDLDCYALVERLDAATMPQLSFDCGLEDHLLDGNRRFHAFLEERGVPHRYIEHPGQHDWAYWDAHLPEALAQHRDVFARRAGSVGSI